MNELLQQLLVAAGLGALVGLQRERVESRLAGLRTFTLATLLGALCAQLGSSFGGWVVAVGMVAIIAAAIIGNLMAAAKGHPDPGQTTELALVVMYAVGAYTVVGPMPLAVALGAGVAVLLHAKERLHGIIDRIGDDDFRAIMHFVLVSMVVLPILPDRTFGPYGVLNPREVWLMVVLIVGISLAGYLAYKMFGAKGGSLLGGVLGGLISSTATTVSYARLSREDEKVVGPAAAVILLASAVAFARILTVAGIVAPALFLDAAVPLGALTLLFVGIGLIAWYRQARGEQQVPEPKNPSDLKSALIFAGLYAVILLSVAAARDYLGRGGLYIVAVISGLTDVDAITLSTSNLVNARELATSLAWRVITIAALSNMVFKAGAVAVLGQRALFMRIAVGFGIVIAAGLAMVFLWP